MSQLAHSQHDRDRHQRVGNREHLPTMKRNRTRWRPVQLRNTIDCCIVVENILTRHFLRDVTLKYVPIQTQMRHGCTHRGSGLGCISMLNHQKLRQQTSRGVGKHECDRTNKSKNGSGLNLGPRVWGYELCKCDRNNPGEPKRRRWVSACARKGNPKKQPRVM